jgi:3-oxoacyl-[acyl-carrier protein] reductase
VDLELRGKRVLVTGSTRGIGRAAAEHFLEEGARVVLTSRSEAELRKAKEELASCHAASDVLYRACDFRSPGDIRALREFIASSWDGLDVLVANVGHGVSVPDPIPDRAHMEEVFAENLHSAIDSAREFLPVLAASKGSIVFVSSIAGVEAFGAPVDYSVAKTAVIAFSKNLARKAADEGVRVNCVAPGNVYFEGGSWDMKLKDDPERIRGIIESTVPMKRFADPAEIADAILFLSSPRASFITGACLIVDGGQTTTLY